MSEPEPEPDPTPDLAFESVVLATKRLTLRPLRDDDAAALFAMHADEATMRYWSTPAWTDRDEAARKIERDRAASRQGSAIGFGITRREDDLLIGTCALHAFHRSNRRCEIGYLLAREHWGRGLMREALTPLLRHGFTTLELHRIEADVDPGNVASARLLDRLGFRREGRMRERWFVDGRYGDSEVWGLLEAEWRADDGRT